MEVLVAASLGLGIPFCIWVSTTLVKILQYVSSSDTLSQQHVEKIADHEARIRVLEGN
jgi:hypothetical protein